MFSNIQVLPSKCQNKPGPKMRTCEEIKINIFQGPSLWHLGSMVQDTREVIPSKKYWPKTDYWPKAPSLRMIVQS